MDRIEHEIAIAERSKRSVAVLMLDLDRFKNINDTFGHDQGDKLLQIVSVRLQAAARETDTVARLGGDEFVILLENPGTPEEVAAVATRIVIGIAIYPADGNDAATLMKNADTAMYEAKAGGKNTFRFFSASMIDKAAKRLRLQIVAEGIETQEQMAYLQRQGCYAGQGYHFCKPLPESELLGWLASRHAKLSGGARLQ